MGFDHACTTRALGIPAPVAGALLTLLGLAADPAVATHAVDSPGIVAGETVVTLNGHHTFDSSRELDGNGEHAFEIGHAPVAWWKTTLGWVWLGERGDLPESAAVAWENVFRLTPPGRYWADVGVLTSYGRRLEGGSDAAEVALLLEKKVGRGTALVNLVAARELAGGMDTLYGYSFSAALPVTDSLDAGIEWYGELGDSNAFGGLGERLHQAGPVVYGEIAAGGAGAFRFEGAVLFGLTAEAPHVTLRLLLEYAFQ